MTKVLPNWPVSYCQLNDPAPAITGIVDNNCENNCGIEAASAVWQWTSGVNMSAAVMKVLEYGPTYEGYTDYAHMQAFLQQTAGIPTGLLVSDADTLFDHMCAWIDADHPSITLRWETTTHGGWVEGVGGHFVCCYGYETDASGNRVAQYHHNVYTGTSERVTRDQFRHALQIIKYDAAGKPQVSALACNHSRATWH